MFPCVLYQKPDDVPIPGGTVYVRQKECTVPMVTGSHNNGNSGTSQHQHIRRFIIPRDAVAVASKALENLESQNNNGDDGEEESTKVRPKSSKSDITSMRRPKSSKSEVTGIRRPKTATRHLSQQSFVS